MTDQSPPAAPASDAGPPPGRRAAWTRAARVLGALVLLAALAETWTLRDQRPRAVHALQPFTVTLESMPQTLVATPVVERDVVVDGVRMHYAEGGSGSPIVFCHGWGLDHRNWFRNLEPLAAIGHVYAIDWPGFGLSDTPANTSLTPEYQAQKLLGFLRALDLENVTLVGHSMGGHWTSTLLLKRPHRVTRYVAVGSAAMMPRPPAYRRAVMQAALAPYLRWRAARPDKLTEQRKQWRRLLLGPDLVTDEFLAQVSHVNSWTEPDAVPAMRGSVGGLFRHSLRTRLHEITVPTLVIWGARDNVVAPRYAALLARTLPNARLLLFEQSGHHPMIQEPDRFNRAIAQFVMTPYKEWNRR